VLFCGYHGRFLCQESLEEKIQEVQKKLEELEKSAPEKADIKVNTLARSFSSDIVPNKNTSSGEKNLPVSQNFYRLRRPKSEPAAIVVKNAIQ
jgi:hypothetical protein